MSNYTVCDNCGIEIHGLGMTVTETDCPECGETTSVTPVGGPREILRSQVTSSPAVNGGASLPQRGTRSSGSVSRLALPASMGRVSTLGRERLVALSRALPSESVSSRSIFNRPLSPNRSNLAVLCRHGSHLVGQRPSTGLPARRKHGWSAAHIPRSFAMGCGVTLSKHTFADDLAVSVGVPAVPLAAVASRNGRDSRPP